jgi:hypothetical protein
VACAWLESVFRRARSGLHRWLPRVRVSSCVQTELTLADLSSSLEARGINLSKPEYYADNVFAGGMLSVHAAVQPTQVNLQQAPGKEAAKKKQ